MIASRRRAHRRIFPVLALVMPAVFLAALMAQPTRPTLGEIPESLQTNRPSADDTPLWERGDLFENLDITARGYRGAVELELATPLYKPDVLVYWTPRNDAVGLPEDAHLIGRIASPGTRRFELPQGALGGRLILYSLGHTEVIASGVIAAPSGSGE